MSNLDSYYFCLNKSRYIDISEFIRIKDFEEIEEVEKMFSNESLSMINKGIIVPMKYSNKIFFSSLIFDEAKVEEYQKAIEVTPHIKENEYLWDFRSSYYIVDRYFPLLPARTKFFLNMNKYDLRGDPDLDEKLKMLNWNDKRIYLIECMTLSDENYSFVVFLLEIQKVQEWLSSIKLKTRNLTNCLKIIELLSK